MVAFGRKQGGGRRTADRNVAPLSAIFSTIANSYGTCLVDLSCSGARLTGGVLPKKGQEVMLSIGRLRAFATVVWEMPGQCGAKFDLPLANKDVGQVCSQAAEYGDIPLDLRDAIEDWQTGFAR